MPIKILLIGSGGRESALLEILAKSPLVSEIICAPGNGGMAASARRPVKADDLQGLLQLAKAEKVDFAVVGPEQPLVDGIVDLFGAHHINIFGPTRKAARLEGSKIFCKEVCIDHGIPTAEYRDADNIAQAASIINTWGGPLVIKADGLAAGKGVKVCSTVDDALSFAHDLLVKKTMGAAGNRIVIERKLEGRECSVMALCDGTYALLLPPARDYKRAYDGDQGDNTGGMGAYSPLPDVDDTLLRQIKTGIIDKLMSAMQRRGCAYHGVLYAGIMLTADGPKLLEVNCRFGDPETQVVLPRLRSDLVPLLLACTSSGGLSPFMLRPPAWDDRAAVCVVMASEGYPGKCPTGIPIHGLEEARMLVHVYEAGVEIDPDKGAVTSGGRVLAVVGLGRTIMGAQGQAYRGASKISWPGEHHRRDIAD